VKLPDPVAFALPIISFELLIFVPPLYVFAVLIVTTPVPDKLTDPVPETLLVNVIFTLTRIFNIPPLFKTVLVGSLTTLVSTPLLLLIIFPVKL
jgi:hypothetical protein